MKQPKWTVDSWNDAHPVGTPMRFTPSRGAEPIETKTRSQAWALGHGDIMERAQ